MEAHVHAQYQLSMYVGAPRRFSVARQTFRGSERASVIIQSGEPHASEPVDDEAVSLRTFYLDVETVAEAARSIWHGEGTVAFPDARLDDPPTVAALLAAHRALDGGDLEAEVRLACALERLVRRHATPTGAARALRSSEVCVARARELLEDRLADPLNLGELADAAGLSRFHLIRLFRRQFGVTPFVYQRNRRVERARATLRAGGSIADAVASAGFADQSHLGRTFRAVMGSTPGQYRSSYRH
jgi:AraC-like DNA-binding protein